MRLVVVYEGYRYGAEGAKLLRDTLARFARQQQAEFVAAVSANDYIGREESTE